MNETPETTAANPPKGGSPHVFVVDDDREIRTLVRAVLENSSFQVSEESSAEAMLRRIGQDDFDLILLDIHLPGMDGFTACRAVKRNVSVDKIIPIIMLTARDDRASVIQAIKAGADDYVVKPFDPTILVEKIRKHIKG